MTQGLSGEIRAVCKHGSHLGRNVQQICTNCREFTGHVIQGRPGMKKYGPVASCETMTTDGELSDLIPEYVSNFGF